MLCLFDIIKPSTQFGNTVFKKKLKLGTYTGTYIKIYKKLAVMAVPNLFSLIFYQKVIFPLEKYIPYYSTINYTNKDNISSFVLITDSLDAVENLY